MEKPWPLVPKFGEKSLFSGILEIKDTKQQNIIIHEILDRLTGDDFEGALYDESPYKTLVQSHLVSCDACLNKQATIANRYG